MLAGIYVGIGIMLIFTVGGLLSSGGSPLTKIIMGASFGIALSLVIFAGAELFTGNNFVMAIGMIGKTVTFMDTLKEESSKLIMIFWCLFAFITTGFEHSVANMTLMTIGLLSPFSASVSVYGYGYNLLFVTLGNMVGGIVFLAIPYYIISRNKNK